MVFCDRWMPAVVKVLVMVLLVVPSGVGGSDRNGGENRNGGPVASDTSGR